MGNLIPSASYHYLLKVVIFRTCQKDSIKISFDRKIKKISQRIIPFSISLYFHSKYFYERKKVKKITVDTTHNTDKNMKNQYDELTKKKDIDVRQWGKVRLNERKHYIHAWVYKRANTWKRRRNLNIIIFVNSISRLCFMSNSFFLFSFFLLFVQFFAPFWK